MAPPLPALEELSLQIAWLKLRLKRLSGPPDPPILYHYTNANGVYGILKDGCLRASAAEFSNDAAEIAYAQSIGRAIHDEIWRNKQRKDELPDWEHFLMSEAREIFKNPTEIFGPLFFVSFCEDGDLLSQWRAYARPGYSLGFRNLSINQRPNLTSQEFQLMTCKVIYEPQPQRDEIREILEDLRTLIAPWETKADSTKIEWCQAFLRALLIREVRTWFCRVKHKAFSEESEWRIVAFRDSPPAAENHEQDTRGFCVRPATHLLRPFTVLRALLANKLPLAEVICGPSATQQLSEKGLRIFLRTKGYENVDVKCSETPLRE